MLRPIFLMPILLPLSSQAGAAVNPVRLSCESRTNPLGVDVATPRLGWQLTDSSNGRGIRQSAYQVLVASSPQILTKNSGDLWDSGRVALAKNLDVLYGGRPLRSAQAIFWKVRIWDGKGQPSAWSQNAKWTMGLLQPSDWTAQWLASPIASEVQRKAIGYHAAETTGQEDTKWVQVDLGAPMPLEAVRLHPMFHANRAGFGFPLRFKVEAANDAAFQAPTGIADQTASDFLNPGTRPVPFDAKGITARFVRVTATKLQQRDATIYAFALSQLEVVSGGKNVAEGATVTAKDSAEFSGWGKVGLTDGALNPPVEAGKKYETLLLRREFTVKAGLRRAIAFVSGLGHYEMSLNGAKVGDDLLAPGWTNYRKTVLYDTRDLTASLRLGANAIGLILGNGMYNVLDGRYNKFTGSFGPQKAIVQLRLEYNDGSVQTIGTDERWRVASGPITFSGVYGGEDYDARLASKGWDAPGFNASAWAAPQIVKSPGGKLRGVSVANPPIRQFEKFAPVSTRILRPGVTVYDMGQNASVMPRITVSGPAGSTVRIVPGELLNPDGSVSQSSGGGPSYWQYTLAGTGNETYFPKFFYRGSRYQQVEVTPAPGSTELPVVQSIECVMVHADSPVAGTFTTSNPLFNRTWNLVRWAQRSNMVSVMTDCPHREKLGWLEEDYLNGPALRYNFDMANMFAKVMNDIADSQVDNGFVPSIAPEYVKFGGDGDGNPFRNSPEWGSAFVLIAWQQYQFNGDLELLRRHYDGMKRYVSYLDSRANDHILDFGLGDWFDIGPGEPGPSKLTPRALTATAIYFEDVTVLAHTARLLGNKGDAERYEALVNQIRSAFNTKFFNPATRAYATSSQTANSMPLVVGLVDPANRVSVVEAIVKDVQAKGLTAGDVGYRYLLRALADNGRSDVIYAMNNQSDKPGYGMQLKRGATSLTEAWDANPGPSQNHFMLGQINEWFFHDLAGIQPAAPGFSKITIKPAFVGDLTHVAATHVSGYGAIKSEWTRQNLRITLAVSIPANTTANIHIPASNAASVKEGGKPTGNSTGVTLVKIENGVAIFAVRSGTYKFTSVLPG
ncbi:hypothetical protein EON83_01910 [bacterium]|nr:MAG: hypothetical protein EON83_01910 [bacterium]